MPGPLQIVLGQAGSACLRHAAAMAAPACLHSAPFHHSSRCRRPMIHAPMRLCRHRFKSGPMLSLAVTLLRLAASSGAVAPQQLAATPNAWKLLCSYMLVRFGSGYRAAVAPFFRSPAAALVGGTRGLELTNPHHLVRLPALAGGGCKLPHQQFQPAAVCPGAAHPPGHAASLHGGGQRGGHRHSSG